MLVGNEGFDPLVVCFAEQLPDRRAFALQKRLVEHSGIEPLTSCMPCRRSPS